VSILAAGRPYKEVAAMGLVPGGLVMRRVVRVAALSLVLASVAGTCGWLIARDAAARGVSLQARFDARAEASSRFVEAYVDEVLGRALRLALTAFSGDVTQEGFAALASAAGFRTGGLFDNRERLIAALPATPQLLGTTSLDDRLPTLRAAMDGRSGVSDVITSVATGERIVFFAMPFFAGDQGWRVFSGSFPVAQTPFEGYLANAIPFRPVEAYLIDSTGAVVASNIPRLPPTTLAEHRPALAGALAARPTGFIDAGAGTGDGRTYFSSAEVPGTPWQVVFSTPERVLYAPLGGARWLPWTILAGFVLAGLAGIGTSERYLAQRARLGRERHAAHAALVEAERRFRVAFDMAPVGMALTSLEADDLGRLIRVNRTLSDILGYTVEELEERTLTDITHPDDRASLQDITARLHDGTSAGTHNLTFEKRCLHADGHLLWVEMHATAIDDEVGAYHYAVAQVDDITDRRAESERLSALALQDPLTGLGNRSLLTDRLAQALTRTARSCRPVAVLMCDLDGFKPVNDTYGHAAGDLVLRQVAARLRDVVRASDTVARIGGDEFVILCEDLDHHDTAELVARRIEQCLDAPYVIDEHTQIRLRASIGISIDAGPGLDPADLLAEADHRMYEAKRHHHATTPGSQPR
jgi:diguanylate cyclase (GGDEF)-like protein/PAS domain S-box-containing protein